MFKTLDEHIVHDSCNFRLLIAFNIKLLFSLRVDKILEQIFDVPVFVCRKRFLLDKYFLLKILDVEENEL
jgi:hypothetical protein